MINNTIKLGDIVVNDWAGPTNPGKVLMFIRKTSRLVHCVALSGRAVEFRNDKELRLRVITKLDLSPWYVTAAAGALAQLDELEQANTSPTDKGDTH